MGTKTRRHDGGGARERGVMKSPMGIKSPTVRVKGVNTSNGSLRKGRLTNSKECMGGDWLVEWEV